MAILEKPPDLTDTPDGEQFILHLEEIPRFGLRSVCSVPSSVFFGLLNAVF